MTRPSISSRAAVAALALAASLWALGAHPALADDRASIEQGRAAGRGVLLMRDPKACGIVLLRERCIADVDAFQQVHGRNDADYAGVPKVGTHPATGLRAYVANGDRDGFDFALAWYNTAQARQQRWDADPRDAALYDAGVLNVTMPAAGANEVAQILAAGGPVIDLARHADKVPAGVLPVDAAPLRTMAAEANSGHPNAYRMKLVPFAVALAKAVATSAPQTALAAVPQADTPAADAALGVTFATMAELIDSPQWAVQDDAQALASALADRLDKLVPPSGHDDVAAFRAATRDGTTFNHDRALQTLTAGSVAFVRSAPRERAQRFALASAAAQLGYNAAVLRAPDTAADLLRFVAAAPALDAAIPGWAAARAAGGSIGATDWLAQRAHALRLVDLIEKANAS